MLTQILAEELPSLKMDELKEISVSLLKSASNLFRLLENLFQWASMSQGIMVFNPKVIQLELIIDESLDMIRESAKSKDIEIVKEISPNLSVYADTNMFHSVVRNLVSNAVKFTKRGGKISISAWATDAKTIKIAVKDSGIGMSPDMIADLFRLDVKTNRIGTEGESSTGLGLLLCKDFIEKNMGKLWVESEVDKGSTFYFTIPCKTEL